MAGLGIMIMSDSIERRAPDMQRVMVEGFSITFPFWLATHPRAAHQPEDQAGLRSPGGLSGEGIEARLRFGESRGLPDRGLATLPGLESALCWPRASGVEAWHRTCQIASPWDGQAMLVSRRLQTNACRQHIARQCAKGGLRPCSELGVMGVNGVFWLLVFQKAVLSL